MPLAAYLALLPAGVCHAAHVAMCAVGSYPTVSPLPPVKVAVCFLWHFPSRAARAIRAQVLPGSLSTGARTFLEIGITWILMRDRPTICLCKYSRMTIAGRFWFRPNCSSDDVLTGGSYCSPSARSHPKPWRSVCHPTRSAATVPQSPLS